MRLLYSTTAYPPSTGGAQMLHHMTAQSLKEQHEIQVVSHWEENRTDWLLGTTIHAPKSEHDYIIDGINVHRLGLTAKEKISLIPLATALLSTYASGTPLILLTVSTAIFCPTLKKRT